MSLATLKQNRNAALESILAEVDKFSQKRNYSEDGADDPRFWYPALDKAGNGNAIIRFLPAHDEEAIPFVRFWWHSFQGPTGSWIFREMCPTTKGRKCPICEYNRILWNSGDDDKKKQASKQKRKLQFVSNIYIEKDPANPENEGQVRLFRYGQKIWDKLNGAMHPAEELGEDPMNPFDPLGPDKDGNGGGAPFLLKIRKVDNQTNYNESGFGKTIKALTDDKHLEEILGNCHKLQPFIDDSVFNVETIIRTKLNRVLGLGNDSVEDEIDQDKAALLIEKSTKSSEDESPFKGDSDDDEMNEDYFKRIASD